MIRTTLKDFISDLNKLKDKYGENVGIQFSGCYGSETSSFYFDEVTCHIAEVLDTQTMELVKEPYINIPTDLCSG